MQKKMPTSLRSLASRHARPLVVLAFAVVLVWPAWCSPAWASPAPDEGKPTADVLVFTNGDQLSGKLLRAVGGTVTFHSDMAGDIEVSWDKIRSLHSSQPFAVIRQGQKVTRKTPEADIPQGALSVEDQEVRVESTGGGAPAEIPVQAAQFIIDQGTFSNDLRSEPRIVSGWSGTVSAGATIVQGTENSRSFAGAANLSRTIPSVDWLAPRNRTILLFNGAYGTVTQPGISSTKTNIVHGEAERDLYFTPRFYALGYASFDHNYSQGLDLQQIYGGGLGRTLLKDSRQNLDVKFDIHYEKQQFSVTPGEQPPPNKAQNLIGADVGDSYALKLPRHLVFTQAATITPAFNNANAYSAVASAGLAFPVYRQFSLSLNALDNYLNDPAAGSKKNSFQFITAVQYTFK